MKHLHLKTSIFAVLSIGLIYGIAPNKTLPILFDFSVMTTDLKNIFRAIMGLYSGMVVFWFIGIKQPKFWEAATITNICFMSGLAVGRLFSFFIDGKPSIYFIAGFIFELFFACWGISNLRNQMNK